MTDLSNVPMSSLKDEVSRRLRNYDNALSLKPYIDPGNMNSNVLQGSCEDHFIALIEDITLNNAQGQKDEVNEFKDHLYHHVMDKMYNGKFFEFFEFVDFSDSLG